MEKNCLCCGDGRNTFKYEDGRVFCVSCEEAAPGGGWPEEHFSNGYKEGRESIRNNPPKLTPAHRDRQELFTDLCREIENG